MKYKPRPGIVMAKICDMNLLIPTRMAFSECQAMLRLPVIWALTWNLLVEEDDEKIFQLHKILTKKTDDEIKERLDMFYKEMVEKGFMIVSNEATQE